MGHVVKIIAMSFVLVLLVLGTFGTHLELFGLLALAASFIYREKYNDGTPLLVAEAVVVLLLAQANAAYLFLLGVAAFDLTVSKRNSFVPLLLIPGVLLISREWLAMYALTIALSGFSGYLAGELGKKLDSLQAVYDRERRLRYSLEDARARLLRSAGEAAHLAEIRERNRIAREIHDHVGHSLVGVLLHLQAADKLLDTEPARARAMFAKSVTKLADAVELLRSTVHNLRPREQLGLAYLQQVIDNFRFCPVDFAHQGDFASLSPDQVAVITSILKEALTNAARHSQATRMEVRVEVREKIVRLYIRDNGVGCGHIREGLGISGMKERVRDAGGTITFSCKDGFMIVCVLPREQPGGGALESAYR